MKEYIVYLEGRADACRAETARLLADGRKDDADIMKVRTNIYDVCRTVSLALGNRPGAGSGAVKAQLERFRGEWGAALEKAKQRGDVRGVLVEETKLSALDDAAARFEEAAGL